MEKSKGWKTIIFGVLVGATAALSSPELQAFISQHIPEVGSALGVAIIVLRALTTSSIFKP